MACSQYFCIVFVLTISSGCLYVKADVEVSSNATELSDRRCKCVCPRVNGTGRALFIRNVSPEQCNCDNVILPRLVIEGIKEDPSEFCARCQCKHESRNSATIKTVVICFIGVTGLLFVYMVYLLIEARLCKGKMFGDDAAVTYEEQIDDEFASASRTSMNESHKSLRRRIGERMSRWKQAVTRQRGNVYIRRTVLNN